jgi:hypothetical protein
VVLRGVQGAVGDGRRCGKGMRAMCVEVVAMIEEGVFSRYGYKCRKRDPDDPFHNTKQYS